MAAESPPRRRLTAWLVTGPVAHAAAGVLDVAAFLLATARARIGRSREGE